MPETTEADRAAARAAFIRHRHQVTTHAHGPGCHCRLAGMRPNPGSGLHVAGACVVCDAWRASPRGQAEAIHRTM